MQRLLSAREVPFFLTVLLGLFSWTVARTVDRLVESPVVEYQSSVVGDSIAVVFANVSRDERIAGVTLSVHALRTPDEESDSVNQEDPSAFVGSSVRVVLGRATNLARPPVIANRSISFQNTTLQPGDRVEINARLVRAGGITVRARSATSTVRLVARSWETRLVEHELGVLLAALGLWAVMIGVYMWAARPEDVKDGEAHKEVLVRVSFDAPVDGLTFRVEPRGRPGTGDGDHPGDGAGGEGGGGAESPAPQ